MNELLLYSLGVYLGTCLIWLIITYVYCNIHYDAFTIEEMIGFGNTYDADNNYFLFFFPFYNTCALLVICIIIFCCSIGYLLDRINNIKLK